MRNIDVFWFMVISLGGAFGVELAEQVTRMDISRCRLIDRYYSALLDFELLGSLDVTAGSTGVLEVVCGLVVIATLSDAELMTAYA